VILDAPDPPLGDGVVTLRPPDERDLDAIDIGIHDPDVVRWFGAPDMGAAEVLALNRRRWAAGSPTFAICEQDDRCVGHVWMNLAPDDVTTGSVGYWLLPNARGRGLATRAVRLIADWSVRELGMMRLRLYTEPANEPSRRVAERSGFRRMGRLHAHGEVDGRSIDHVLFELTPGP
jgi:RimJ/RimL family protein N-acetyltransferase